MAVNPSFSTWRAKNGGFTMQNNKTIIRIRRGIKTRYCACDNAGNPIRGFNKLSDVRRYWQKEIQWGYVELVRELDKMPDTKALDSIIKSLDAILRAYTKKS